MKAELICRKYCIKYLFISENRIKMFFVVLELWLFQLSFDLEINYLMLFKKCFIKFPK